MPLRKAYWRTTALALVIAMEAAGAAGAQEQAGDAQALIERAAEALGGADAIEGLTSLKLLGYAQTAYQWGGGNITADPDAPQKWQANNALERIWDFENDRYQQLQRNNFLFPFAATFGHSFALVNQVLDGDVAYNIGANGAASRVGVSNPGALNTDGVYDRRMWSLTNPVTAVRAALVGDAEVSNLREEDGYQVVDLTVGAGKLELAVDAETGLPHHISWPTAHSNLGQVEYTTTFSGYMPFDGIELPLGAVTKLDWRDTIFMTHFVDGYVVNGEVPDLAAPEEIRAANVPVVTAPELTIEPVADRIWRISNGTSVLEFADHMTLYELGGNQVVGKAVIELAKTIRPEKPITELIISHHHFDHTGGVRAAVAEGMTLISRRGNEGVLRDIATRPAPDFPSDLLPEGGEFKFIPVDEHLRLEDAEFGIDVYHVVDNNHMADALFLYHEPSKVMIEGDIGTAAADWQFWADSYQDNLEHYGIEVEKISPVHQRIFTHDELIEFIRPGAHQVKERCDTFAADNNWLPGCPAFVQREW